ncbi:MAG: hypothetical protein HY842_10940 [Bacteroidetes bacterium]|nr:hypothetical protein [Bacteroidota bacterium]
MLSLFLALEASAQTAAIDSLKTVAQAAVRQNDRRAEAVALRQLAREQADMGNAIEALHNAQRALQIFESLGEKSEVFNTYNSLLAVYQQLHDGQQIIEIATKGIEYSRGTADTSLLIVMTTALGIGYDETNQDEKAVACYLECIALEEAIGKSSALSHGNVSSSFSSLGKFDEAIRHARLAYEIALPNQDTMAMVLGKLNESYALALSGRGNEALDATGQTEALAASLHISSLDRDIVYLKSLGFAGKKDFEKAYRYHLQYFQMDSTLSSAERNAHFAELEAVYQTKRKEVENAQLSADIARQRTWLAAITGAVLLLGAAVWFQRKRLKINAKLLETEKTLAKTERLRALEEIQFFQRELDDYTQLLIEKNQAIEALKAGLETAALSENAASEKEDLQAQLMQATILTEADWRNFRQKFERVHGGFFEKMGQEVPDATEAEQRLAVLTKLELSNPEIAAMLGISPESVSKTRYRLRKKLGERDLGAVLREI